MIGEENKQAANAAERRVTMMLATAYADYLIQVQRIEKRRLTMLSNIGKSPAFADYMIDQFGDEENSDE